MSQGNGDGNGRPDAEVRPYDGNGIPVRCTGLVTATANGNGRATTRVALTLQSSGFITRPVTSFG